MCASLPPPTNGQILYFDSTAPYNHGTVATYICNTGFGIARGDVNTVCSDDDNEAMGRWTRIPPTCERKQCNANLGNNQFVKVLQTMYTSYKCIYHL